MTIQTKAMLVHLFTATGAVFAMLAMLAAAEGKWSLMFLWLLVAFAVDGIDGPLARRYDVASNAPRFDGALLDLIIDYLTYVFIPSFALFTSGLLAGWTGWVSIIVITFSSAVYFCDTSMKTQDKSFQGFPGCWNMAILVIFALKPAVWIIVLGVATIAIAMFLPVRFVHPVRTKRWRIITLPIAFAWVVFATLSAWLDFEINGYIYWGLVVSTTYLMCVGMIQQVFSGKVTSI